MTASAITSKTAAFNTPSAERAVSGHNETPPHVQLIQMAVPIWTARALYAAAKLNIADLLADRPRSTGELATSTATHAPSLYRLLRALASVGILTEVEPSHFALTGLGQALRTGAPGSARATVLTLAGDWQWKAWDNVLYSLQTGQPGMIKAFGAGIFDYLTAHPDDGDQFNQAMIGMHGAVGPAVVAAYDFSGFRSVIDVGGGVGMLLATILRSNQNLHGAIFELPAATARAQRLINEQGLADRCDVISGDFFNAVPPGHDAYILSHVLHDWNDEQALAILRNCRRAIAPGGRLLIVEAVLPEGNTSHHGKLMDLLMLTVTGGMERTAEQFSALLAAADFRLVRIVPTSTHQSVIEALPV